MENKMMRDYQLLDEWLHHGATEYHHSENTTRQYRSNVAKFFVWFHDIYNESVLAANMNVFLDYRDYLFKNLGCNIESTKCFTKTVKSFYKWLVLHNYLEHSPYPPQMPYRHGRPAKPLIILTPQTIFRIRRKHGLKLLSAVIFELYISTGMRLTEGLQLRYCDIDYLNIPIDTTTGEKSIYCGGAITLSHTEKVIKTRTTRVTYLSALAIALIRRYARLHDISMDSTLPVIPGTRILVQHRLNELGTNLGKYNFNVSIDQTPKVARNDQVMTQAEFNKLSPKMQKRLKRFYTIKKIHEENQDPEIIYVNRTGRKRQHLHPHSLRHTFASIQYFRTYYGTYKDIFAVKRLLGHNSLNITNRYIDCIDLIRTEREWSRIMLGRPGDWNVKDE